MSTVKFRSESYDPDFPLQDELMTMEKNLYPDVPEKERSAYREQEKLWIAQAPRNVDYATHGFAEPDKMLPVGVNGTVAVALYHEGASGKRLHMVYAEQQQFTRGWEAILRRCRYRLQYDAKYRQMLGACDPAIKPGLERILRNEDLIKFRDALPAEGSGTLLSDFEEREDSAVGTSPVVKEVPSMDSNGASFRVMMNRYKTSKRWKETSICGSSPTFPACSVSEKYLSLVYYLSDTTVRMQLYDLVTRKMLVERHYTMSGGPLRSSVSDDGWMAAIDGTTAIVTNGQLAYQHVVESQVLTAVRLGTEGTVFLGTYNGQLYHVSHKAILSYNKTLDCNAVLGISSARGTMISINGICHEQIYFNIRRPLTVFTRGTFILSLNKHGVIRIGSTVHSKVDIFFKPTKDHKCDIAHVTPWYDDGIWFDGNSLVTLYPEGTVRVISIK
jgi:hypothetical protein